jgi:hypothetical protein
MDIKKLEYFFNKNIIPKKLELPLTFLGISKQPHYENVISNIYAFFLDPEQEHGFDDLFLTSLFDCINEVNPKGEFMPSDEYQITTETSTDCNGRIDILLTGETNAIIIENKIYHHLDNGLKDYWESATKNIDKKTSIGIVLSLIKNEKIEHPRFINITHKEFMNKVSENIGKYHLSASLKYLTFLQDFQQNIYNLSNKLMEKEHLKIYLENQSEIEDAIALKKQYKEKVYEQVNAIENEKLIKDKLIERNKKHPKKGAVEYKKVSIFQSKDDKSLRLKISYEHLWEKDSYFKIRLDLRFLDDKKKCEKIFNEFKIEKLLPNQEERKGNVVAIKTYKPSIEEKMDLTTFIVTKLDEDGFIEIFKEIEKTLKQTSN